jgi:hypothetical protein
LGAGVLFFLLFSINLLLSFGLPCVGFGGSFVNFGLRVGWRFANVPPNAMAILK